MNMVSLISLAVCLGLLKPIESCIQVISSSHFFSYKKYNFSFYSVHFHDFMVRDFSGLLLRNMFSYVLMFLIKTKQK